MNKIVKIEWYDAYSLDSWQNKDIAVAVNKEPMLCHSIGYLLSEDDKSVSICHTFNNDNQVCGVIQIPKCNIKDKIKYLK